MHKPLLAIALLGAAAIALPGCAAPPAPNPLHPSTTGQALAQAACPHRVAEANAWINYMPGGNRGPRQLNVEVRFSNPNDTAIVLRSDATRIGGALVLDIRTTKSGAIPGRVDYREPVPETPYKRISIFCRGAEIVAITEVQKVY